MSKQIESARSNPALWALAGAGLAALAFVAILAVAGGAGYAAPSAAQQQYAPTNTTRPSITGTAQEGRTVTANPGTWTGDAPIVFTYQWRRCNASGASCVNIPNADDQTYAVSSTDVGDTLRVNVTARNSQGSNTADSAQTAVVTRQGPPTPGASRNVSQVVPPDRLIIDRVQFTPNPVRSRSQPITVRVHVLDTDGFSVQDALVFIRSTPVVTSTPPEGRTGADGWATFQVLPQADMPLRNGYSVQYFVRARKTGDNPLAGVSGRRLVQVRTAR
jgi:hypothetical protein